ncbi:MAG TPA: hypothetical protein VJ868_02590 [Actinomycetota bacterium]|nr:hypothetical protein [Actinomycetota bacterium]
MAIFAILLTVVVGLLQIFGGVNVPQLRRRGRTLGFVGCGIGIALAILGLASGGAAGASVIVSVLILLGDIAAIVLLVQSERHLTT